MAKESYAVLLEHFRQSKRQITDELSKVIIGQRAVIDQILAAILARGHCLLVGVPGLAKTLIVSTLADLMALKFKRIQFTPDLMPSDITGTNIIGENQERRRVMKFVKGPVFANIVLADEINRTPPKTQAALLQSMQEREVTVGKRTYPLPDPFFVIATQNPIEQEGTYPLPEAQLDRFMFNIWVDYPTAKEEEKILSETTGGKEIGVDRILNDRQILNMQRLIANVPISEYVVQYVSTLVRASRPKDPSAPDFVRKMVDWGAGPRAGQCLIWGAKAFAAMDGRYTVGIEDVRHIAVPAMRHRIACNFAAQAEGIDSVGIVKRLIETVPEPEVPKYADEVEPPDLIDIDLEME